MDHGVHTCSSSSFLPNQIVFFLVLGLDEVWVTSSGDARSFVVVIVTIVDGHQPQGFHASRYELLDRVRVTGKPGR
jgi:hypothetical protein